ncbi:MAG: transketolase [Oscillospiraceae bacterium]|nr:transketolase [Oscillospiraceae bacterium]
MTIWQKNELKLNAERIRAGIVRGVYAAKSGHPGGSLSSADIMAYLYLTEMRHNPKNPKWEDRDRFVLSKGHAAPVLYATLANAGYFAETELDNLRHTGAMLQGHPDMKHTPGVDMSTGSLGQGLSAACGIALAEKLKGTGVRVYAVLGDGECQEGQIWEAAAFAKHRELDNLCALVDNNGMQIDGTVAEVSGIEPLDIKFEAFGWNVVKTDAHDFDGIEAAYKAARECKGKPTAIIASSTKGKGVSFMENQVSWHGSAPNKEQFEQAMEEITKRIDALEKEVAK